ncbi:MAG: acyl-CoA thioesterase [Proteobacteria bacterium]|nr:acyl-CoA thioesterase [Pseudomonadota bacterium]
MRIEIPKDKQLTFEMTLPIRWGDMDALGHVNNAVYFRYLESVRVEWLRHVGLELKQTGVGAIVVNAFCNFLTQLEYPGDLLARHYIASPGRSSFDAFVTLARADAPDVICAEGGATTVWFDFDTQKPAPLPDWLRAQFTAAP